MIDVFIKLHHPISNLRTAYPNLFFIVLYCLHLTYYFTYLLVYLLPVPVPPPSQQNGNAMREGMLSLIYYCVLSF